MDTFKKGTRIPHCSLQVVKLNDARETDMYRVNLLGAKDNSFIVIRLSPESLSGSISQDSGEQPVLCIVIILPPVRSSNYVLHAPGAYEEKHFVYLVAT